MESRDRLQNLVIYYSEVIESQSLRINSLERADLESTGKFCEVVE